MAMDQKQLKELGVELDAPFLKLLGVRCLRADQLVQGIDLA